MIYNDDELLALKDNFTKAPLPEPFGVMPKSVPLDIEGTKKNCTAIKPFIKAIMIYGTLTQEIGKPYEADVEGVGIGKKGDKIYVEKKSKNRHIVDLISYDPISGDLRGGFYNPATHALAPYKIKGKGGTDGTAIYLAILSTFLYKSEISVTVGDHYSLFQNCLAMDEISEAYNELCYLSYYIYQALISDIIKLNKPSNSLTRFTLSMIQSGKEGPSTTQAFLGEFNVFKVGKAATVSNSLTIDPKEYESLKYEHPENAFTDEERSLVPQIPDYHVISKEEVFALSEIKGTWGNPPSTKITQIFAEGASSSGKSYLARTIAARLHRPFVSFTCTPNTDESDIKGVLLPSVSDSTSVSDEEKELLTKIESANANEVVEIMSEYLGLPSFGEILFDEDGSYEDICKIYKDVIGKEPNDSEGSQACMDMRQTIVSAKFKELLAKIKDSNEGVKYHYIPSPIIRAVKNGWFLEIQEPACLLQQGMLTTLFDVLEKDSIGMIETLDGPIQRHPDFMCMVTTNRDYKGCKPLNEAARNRFQLYLKMDSPTTEVAMMRIQKKCNITDKKMARSIAELFVKLDQKARDIQATGALTLRNVYPFADAIKRGVDVNAAIYNYLIYAITTRPDEVEELTDGLDDMDIYTL